MSNVPITQEAAKYRNRWDILKRMRALELAANGLRESSANYVRCVRKATEGGMTDLHAAGLRLLKAFEDFDALQPKEPHE